MVSHRAYFFVMVGFFLLLTADVVGIVAGSRFVTSDAVLVLKGLVDPLCKIVGSVLGTAGILIQIFASARR